MTISLQNSILKNSTEKFDFVDPPFDPIEYSKELAKFMIDNNALGISSNQISRDGINIPYRIFAMRGYPNNTVCFNPIIVDSRNPIVEIEEGCLSFPGIVLKIKRFNEIRLRFTNPNGMTETQKFTGITAAVIQHEMDHLNGITFADRVSNLKLNMAIRKAAKRGYEYNISNFKAPHLTFITKG